MGEIWGRLRHRVLGGGDEGVEEVARRLAQRGGVGGALDLEAERVGLELLAHLPRVRVRVGVRVRVRVGVRDRVRVSVLYRSRKDEQSGSEPPCIIGPHSSADSLSERSSTT